MKPDLDLASTVMLSTPTARREQTEAFLHPFCQLVIYHALASESHSARLPMLFQLASSISVPTLRRAQTRSTHLPVSMCEMDKTASLSATLVEPPLYPCLSRGVMGDFALNFTRIVTTLFSTSYCSHIEVAIKISMQGKPRLHPMGSRSF